MDYKTFNIIRKVIIINTKRLIGITKRRSINKNEVIINERRLTKPKSNEKKGHSISTYNLISFTKKRRL